MKYRLLKDTPTLKAGTVLELNGDRLFFRASPDWDDEDQQKWYGSWDHIIDKPFHDYAYRYQCTTIHFKSKDELEESFEKHPNEWRTYLAYERS